MPRLTEIETAAELTDHLAASGHLRRVVIEGVDLGEVEIDWSAVDVRDSFFIGCRTPDAEVALALHRGGAAAIPELGAGRPFQIYPPHLYTYEDLVGGGIDQAVQQYFDKCRSLTGSPEPDEPIEAIAQRLHDTAMTDAIWELVAADGEPARRMVGIMGGHATRRDDPAYWAVAALAYAVTEAGFTVATGGGPGVMEAGNLGAYLTRGEGPGSLDAARELLETAPTVFDAEYGARAEAVHRRYADGSADLGGVSLAIPTWLYENEPVGRFASHIAKYFANSIREDGLLRVARSGIVFAPGGAGTVQEVFQDLSINTYAEPPQRAPMVFLGVDHFTASGVHDVVSRIAAASDPPFDELVTITDDVDEALAGLVSG